METIELSGIIGMIALAALAANFFVGIFIWSKREFALPYQLTFLQLHKFTGYSAAIAILLHIVLIPLDPKSGFTWGDLLLPAWTQHQPLANTFGSVALYLIGVVVISSYYKDKIKLRTWRTLHFLSYFAAVPLILHSIITDPKLEDRPIDWFDAEKLFVIACCVAIIALSTYRFFIKEKDAGY
ncbi:MAG: ferric reductase-like transmembrane domain-containing protein [Bacteroidota bacterium]|jgi:sulfoxide reductase heme-binding subunit YedZ|nr:ferric reductase-like transmembrane domain-containing protein [Cytophagales bacterium]MCE2958695.1 ferric reductase-like transmembrane domain-containing protein [Flammeovirgaceae bacterium]